MTQTDDVCETCNGTGEVYTEAQPTGAKAEHTPCPDCSEE